jgi:hypothetical protein
MPETTPPPPPPYTYTDPDSEYEILIAFPSQKLFPERSSVLPLWRHCVLSVTFQLKLYSGYMPLWSAQERLCIHLTFYCSD